MAFIDFEASSLNSGSMPIEVGWVLADGTGESYLIRPALGWTDWSPASERVHRISREMLLQDGREVTWVARRVSEALHGWTLFADEAAYDQYWLDTLLEAGGQKLRRVRPVGQAYGAALRPLLDHLAPETVKDLARHWTAKAEEHEIGHDAVRHRALPDARRLWCTWEALRQSVAAELAAWRDASG